MALDKGQSVEDELDEVVSILARFIVARREVRRWSEFTEVFPWLDRGVAADLVTLVRRTAAGHTVGDFRSLVPLDYFPFVRRVLRGEVLGFDEHP